MQRLILLAISTLLVWISIILPPVAAAEKFWYQPPGDLIPGSGKGLVDYEVYLEGMRFPIENAPAYANSQVHRPLGPRGKGCDDSNYSYPWRDNFCESRPWPTATCPSGKGHQGQDIRPSTCKDNYHWAVAAENGKITGIGPYSVSLQGNSGMRHIYLHLHENSLVVYVGKPVVAGDRIGRISDNYGPRCGGTDCTTYHLHYELRSGGKIFPPYMSLVRSYEELIDEPISVESDVNGDGYADLVSVHSNQNAYVWPGNPDGTFGRAKELFNGTMDSALWDGKGHWIVDVSDVNGDGYADLVSVKSDHYAYIWPGRPDGTFGKAVADFNGTFKSAMSDGVGHEVIAVADVTGDGKGDLVSIYQGSAYVYPGTENGDFTGGISSFNGSLKSAYFDGTDHWVMDAADVNGDGYADLVSVHTNGYAYVWPGSANGTFGKVVADFSGTLNSAMHDGKGHELIGLGDVNGDGRADLVTRLGGTAYVYPGTAELDFDGGVPSFSNLDSSLFDQVGHELIAVMDVTGDGRADLVSARTDGKAYVWPAIDGGKFGNAVPSFGGKLDSSQHDGVGHEFVMQKKMVRRNGCWSTGCIE